MKFRVYFDDTDAMGVVYHANYLRFCERARSEAFFAAGLGDLLAGQGGFVLASCRCEFKAPARLGERIWVRTRLKEQRAASVVLEQRIFLCAEPTGGAETGDGAGEKELFCAEFKLACVDETFRPRKISPELARLFAKI